MIPLPQEPEEEYFDEFNFRKFAATYFLGNISHQYSRRPLKHSLLDLPSPMDRVASQALWITILRFMGDLSEPKYVDDKVDNVPVMTKLTDTVGRAFQKSKEFEVSLINCIKITTIIICLYFSNFFQQELIVKDQNTKSKIMSKTLKRQTKMNEEIMKNLVNDETTNEMYSTWLNSRRSSNLEKLHFIIGHGIIRKELR